MKLALVTIAITLALAGAMIPPDPPDPDEKEEPFCFVWDGVIYCI